MRTYHDRSHIPSTSCLVFRWSDNVSIHSPFSNSRSALPLVSALVSHVSLGRISYVNVWLCLVVCLRWYESVLIYRSFTVPKWLPRKDTDSLGSGLTRMCLDSIIILTKLSKNWEVNVVIANLQWVVDSVIFKWKNCIVELNADPFLSLRFLWCTLFINLRYWYFHIGNSKV